MSYRFTIAVPLAALAAGMSGPAQAEIRCNGNYQLVKGQEIATPYCADNNLAEVARKFGIRVSAAEIRNNAATKGEVCRIAGRDNSVQQTCQSYQSFGRGGR